MTDKEAMQMALDALESLQAWPETPENFKRFRAIEALRARLAQPDVPETAFGEIEPVAWVSDREARMVWWNDKFTHISQAPPRNTPLYTAPPQREWVGLPHEEYEAMAEQCVTNCYFDTLEYAKSIEAKLKEKNT